VELIGPYLVGCALLMVAGAAKFLHPGDTARALAMVLPLSTRALTTVVRWGALAELALGGVAVVFPGPVPATLVGASYVGFAVFVWRARAAGGPVATCGCFGTPDTPASGLHALLDAGIGAAAVAVAVARHHGTITSVLAHQPFHAVPLLLASAASTWLVALAMSGLPRLRAARRLVERTPVGPA
jgi:hypothetical protein